MLTVHRWRARCHELLSKQENAFVAKRFHLEKAASAMGGLQDSIRRSIGTDANADQLQQDIERGMEELNRLDPLPSELSPPSQPHLTEDRSVQHEQRSDDLFPPAVEMEEKQEKQRPDEVRSGDTQQQSATSNNIDSQTRPVEEQQEGVRKVDKEPTNTLPIRKNTKKPGNPRSAFI